MYNNKFDTETAAGYGTLLGAVLVLVFALFIGPFIVMTAWGILAPVLGLAHITFTYWEWFILCWAVRYLIKPSTTINKKS